MHTWKLPPPDASELSPLTAMFSGWQHVELGDDGDLYVIVELGRLLRLDRDSRVEWILEAPVHHDIARGDGGELVVLASAQRWDAMSPDDIFVDNHVLVVSADGVIERRVSMWDVLSKDPATAAILKAELAERKGWRADFEGVQMPWGNPARSREASDEVVEVVRGLRPDGPEDDPRALMALLPTKGDLLHANTIEILESARTGLWEKGDWLVSFRELDLIAVIDPRTESVRWHWGPGSVSAQHQPTLLGNGNLLLFDNGVVSRRSRVIELDPLTKRIVWIYDGGMRPFYSAVMGGAQGLANGNVLITDSMAGRAIEVTREGEIVWEYRSPRSDSDLELAATSPSLDYPMIGTIYRLERVSEARVSSWLEPSAVTAAEAP